jgi:outer membrane protein insertion porin family
VASVLQEDLNAIRTLYLKKGFLDPGLDDEVKIDPQTKAVSITLNIEEGIQTLVASITINGAAPVPLKELRSVLQLKAHEPYQPYLVQSDENALGMQISKLGYPYVQVTSQVTLSQDRRQAHIVYQVEAGPLVKVGQIFFTGNFRTRQFVLEREFDFHQGQAFSLSQVLDAQRRLRDLDLFDSVQVRTIGLKEQEDQVHLLVETSEKKPYYFELGGGYQTNKGPYIRSKIGDHNFMGRNKDIRTSGEISDVGYRWEAAIGDPRFLGTSIRTDFGIYMQREELYNQDFGIDSRGGKLSFSKRWNPQITSDLTWRYEQRVQFLREDADAAETDPETLEDRRIFVVTPSVGYDTRDSFIRPQHGGLATISMDVSRGLNKTLDNFFKYRLDVRRYQSIHPRLTLAGRLRLGYMYEYGVDGQIPEDQLFFLGGTTDVRGYGENLLRYDDQGDPVGGRLAINGSLEGRIDLGHNFEWVLFLDSGSIKEAPEGAGGDDDFHYAAGLGLNYLTPIGPLGLMYGHKLDRREGESSGQFHFAIGYTF